MHIVHYGTPKSQGKSACFGNGAVELVRNIAPYMLISTVVMAAGFQYQAKKQEVEGLYYE
jgi:hypothetical protein